VAGAGVSCLPCQVASRVAALGPSLCPTPLSNHQVRTLVQHALISTDDEAFALQPTEAGKLMTRHFVRLPTMVKIVSLQRSQASMGALIGVLARAQEFSHIMLRRCGVVGLFLGGNSKPLSRPPQRWPSAMA
jgi:hypothetical protein